VAAIQQFKSVKLNDMGFAEPKPKVFKCASRHLYAVDRAAALEFKKLISVNSPGLTCPALGFFAVSWSNKSWMPDSVGYGTRRVS
jgi:hypothetical protein